MWWKSTELEPLTEKDYAEEMEVMAVYESNGVVDALPCVIKRNLEIGELDFFFKLEDTWYSLLDEFSEETVFTFYKVVKRVLH